MFCQFTWWEQYGLFNDYLTRMGYVLSGGDHVAKVVILYPMNSIWANYTSQMSFSSHQSAICLKYAFSYCAVRVLQKS